LIAGIIGVGGAVRGMPVDLALNLGDRCLRIPFQGLFLAENELIKNPCYFDLVDLT